MSKKEHVELIMEGSQVWNAWRDANRRIAPNLCWANLSGLDISWANLSGADLSGVNLRTADLTWANLSATNLTGANLSGAKLTWASLRETNLSWANLSRANLSGADFSGAVLKGGNLSGAILFRANFSRADLREADFSQADIFETTFASNDLSSARGLETVTHRGPSSIDVATLFKSGGTIPEVFLREAGLPEDFIIFVPSLVGRAIEFYSCFISYSQQDEDFSQLLYSRMRKEKLRVWYAPKDMRGGRKLHEEIFRAIQIQDKLLMVLSEYSMKSEWVMTEIRRARKVERVENRRKLFPIRLVDFDAIQNWECFDADSGKDLAAELREYYIPDFSNWKDHDAFEAEFAKLLRDLKATDH
jgi:hypothetical protein